MNKADASIPDFSPDKLYSLTTIILRTPEGVYGTIDAHYPTAMDGGADMDSGRPPLFIGQMQIEVMTSRGAMTIPLTFPILTEDPIEAAKAFKECALKAIDDYRAAAFRQNLVSSGVLPQ